MGARLYDPKLGRFVQADAKIDATNQGLNRYSYVLNNPLSLTDPTGQLSAGQWLRVIVAIAITIYSGGTAAGAAWGYWGAGVTAGQAFAAVVVGGFAAGAVQTGTLQGGVYGAFSAALFYGIGSAFTQGNAGWAYNDAGQMTAGGVAAKTLAHGVAGGVMSSLQGGKFGYGFVSAGVTQLSGGQIDRIDAANPGFSISRTVAAAAVGGTVSAITGGKFANGAVTAAFSRAFNDEATEANHRMVEAARAKGEAMLGPYVSKYNSSDPNYHRYAIGPTNLCTVGPDCSMDLVGPTVASSSIPFVLWYSGEGAYSLPYGLGLDPISHSNPAPGIWVNDTEPGHRYYPGAVAHGLYESGGQLWLYTVGAGVGANPGQNMIDGFNIFGSMHQNVQRELDHLPWDY